MRVRWARREFEVHYKHWREELITSPDYRSLRTTAGHYRRSQWHTPRLPPPLPNGWCIGSYCVAAWEIVIDNWVKALHVSLFLFIGSHPKSSWATAMKSDGNTCLSSISSSRLTSSVLSVVCRHHSCLRLMASSLCLKCHGNWSCCCGHQWGVNNATPSTLGETETVLS